MSSSLKTEQSLGVEQRIVSDNGRYQLVLQSDGNLVLYGLEGRVPGGATWATGTDGQGGTLAVLQSDGNFVLYGPRGRVPGGALWGSGTDGQDVTSLVMQNDGNLVLYRRDGSAAWATDTVEPPPPPPKQAYCCNVFKADGRTRAWQKTLYSSSEAEAYTECLRLKDYVLGPDQPGGIGFGRGVCSSGELKKPEMLLENVDPALPECDR
ncbi:hypothetical protein H6G54_25145 [Anabaena cylindrica FACHB-243]|uniref:Curculin domain protein (Mannose-binding) lectin n=1 Tax=Anabaena cylindrica (strain ATCC 27899 / PCC 7122) TaxID=272123 RepID=K9ZDL3_ANACC|nr:MULTISPECIES: Curculin domain protein (mannose-binding) lectin [Anabaena]AFZ57256.1 Curculin domain protein (mannose-binding) lectin [Anabaena cylindrica PCC 7122]MBD2420925.1 hypothetical protein [Anabaena cylindrica FACHB-243]MBY5283475.1 hypothetical protein [Anabaena sp. CCAP 1446/1C]MBY5307000.1 hypothetical protein [Anabaena sp. CCAP 1446/1C]MCM2405678.1 hypothetical protein [Anabaena sp. CCAP 1446/1C]